MQSLYRGAGNYKDPAPKARASAVLQLQNRRLQSDLNALGGAWTLATGISYNKNANPHQLGQVLESQREAEQEAARWLQVQLDSKKPELRAAQDDLAREKGQRSRMEAEKEKLAERGRTLLERETELRSCKASLAESVYGALMAKHQS
jgi:hypothetical protein